MLKVVRVNPEMKTWRAALVLSSLLAVGVPAAGAGALDSLAGFFSDLNFVSPAQEAQVSAALAQEVEKKQRLLRDPAVRQYVNGVGGRLVRGLGEQPFRYRFKVVADRQVNAFNIGGGHIYVHAGLLEQAGSEGEFASVLAHEIGHQVERHVAKAISRDQVFRSFASAALGKNAGQWAQLAAGLGITTGQAFYGRQAERDADRVMVELLIRSGYDPRASLDLFQRLRKLEGSGRATAIFSSHPPTAERLEAVRGMIAQRRLPGGLARDSRQFHDIQNRLRRG